MGKVVSFQNNYLTLKAKYNPKIGDSIAINGACLTVVKTSKDTFTVELSPESQNILGVMYLQGNMVNQDYGKAFELFEKASIKGEAYASLNLGLMYWGGKGTNKDTKKAIKYFKRLWF